MDEFMVSSEKSVSLSVEYKNSQFNIQKSFKKIKKSIKNNSMLYGYIYSGKCHIENLNSKVELGQGMYFSLDSKWSININAEIFFIEVENYSGLNMFGGPIEKKGRLKYIDNCTDSLIIPPTKLGDPCFNLLVFLKGVNQTQHFHPSFRAGLVVSGSGSCMLEKNKIPLKKGDFFMIPENLTHSFYSSEKAGLSVLAFHPDSDFGPTDMNHPMINKTLLKKGKL